MYTNQLTLQNYSKSLGYFCGFFVNVPKIDTLKGTVKNNREASYRQMYSAYGEKILHFVCDDSYCVNLIPR